MVRLISRQRGGLAALKLTKLFEIDDFPAAKDSGKVLIISIYCYLIIILPSLHVYVSYAYAYELTSRPYALFDSFVKEVRQTYEINCQTSPTIVKSRNLI